MSPNNIYIKFLQKVNKNYTNDNISVDKGRFILLYNEAQNKFIEWVLEKRNEDDIRDIQNLVVTDKKLDINSAGDINDSFKLPKNYFSFINVNVKATKNKCKNTNINSFEVKGENLNELLNDFNNKPSFLFRETFYTFGNNNIIIYKDDFDISKVFMSYYRYPQSIDINGYIKIDGSTSTDVDSEFDDRITDRIISLCAKDFNSNNDNLERYQVDKDRIVSKI